MYGALWRVLPGPVWVKVLTCVVLFLAVVAALFTWVFPWVAEVTGLEGSATMDASAPTTAVATSAHAGPQWSA